MKFSSPSHSKGIILANLGISSSRNHMMVWIALKSNLIQVFEKGLVVEGSNENKELRLESLQIFYSNKGKFEKMIHCYLTVV